MNMSSRSGWPSRSWSPSPFHSTAVSARVNSFSRGHMRTGARVSPTLTSMSSMRPTAPETSTSGSAEEHPASARAAASTSAARRRMRDSLQRVTAGGSQSRGAATRPGISPAQRLQQNVHALVDVPERILEQDRAARGARDLQVDPVHRVVLARGKGGLDEASAQRGARGLRRRGDRALDVRVGDDAAHLAVRLEAVEQAALGRDVVEGELEPGQARVVERAAQTLLVAQEHALLDGPVELGLHEA